MNLNVFNYASISPDKRSDEHINYIVKYLLDITGSTFSRFELTQFAKGITTLTCHPNRTYEISRDCLLIVIQGSLLIDNRLYYSRTFYCSCDSLNQRNQKIPANKLDHVILETTKLLLHTSMNEIRRISHEDSSSSMNSPPPYMRSTNLSSSSATLLRDSLISNLSCSSTGSCPSPSPSQQQQQHIRRISGASSNLCASPRDSLNIINANSSPLLLKRSFTPPTLHQQQYQQQYNNNNINMNNTTSTPSHPQPPSYQHALQSVMPRRQSVELTSPAKLTNTRTFNQLSPQIQSHHAHATTSSTHGHGQNHHQHHQHTSSSSSSTNNNANDSVSSVVESEDDEDYDKSVSLHEMNVDNGLYDALQKPADSRTDEDILLIMEAMSNFAEFSSLSEHLRYLLSSKATLIMLPNMNSILLDSRLSTNINTNNTIDNDEQNPPVQNRLDWLLLLQGTLVIQHHFNHKLDKLIQPGELCWNSEREDLIQHGPIRVVSSTNDCVILSVCELDYRQCLSQAEMNRHIEMDETNGKIIAVTETRCYVDKNSSSSMMILIRSSAPLSSSSSSNINSQSNRIIIMATADRLLNHLLTHDPQSDPTFVEDFILTHRLFLSKTSLLVDLLRGQLLNKEITNYQRDFVVNILCRWLLSAPKDVERHTLTTLFLTAKDVLKTADTLGQLRAILSAHSRSSQIREITIRKSTPSELLPFRIRADVNNLHGENNYGISTTHSSSQHSLGLFISHVDNEQFKGFSNNYLQEGDQLLEINSSRCEGAAGELTTTLNYHTAMELMNQATLIQMRVKQNWLGYYQAIGVLPKSNTFPSCSASFNNGKSSCIGVNAVGNWLNESYDSGTPRRQPSWASSVDYIDKSGGGGGTGIPGMMITVNQSGPPPPMAPIASLGGGQQTPSVSGLKRIMMKRKGLKSDSSSSSLLCDNTGGSVGSIASNASNGSTTTSSNGGGSKGLKASSSLVTSTSGAINTPMIPTVNVTSIRSRSAHTSPGRRRNISGGHNKEVDLLVGGSSIGSTVTLLSTCRSIDNTETTTTTTNQWNGGASGGLDVSNELSSSTLPRRLPSGDRHRTTSSGPLKSLSSDKHILAKSSIDLSSSDALVPCGKGGKASKRRGSSCSGAFDELVPDAAIKVYHKDSKGNVSSVYLLVHRFTTAHEVVMLALVEFGINCKNSSDYALCECSLEPKQGIKKQRLIQPNSTDLPQCCRPGRRLYLRNKLISQNLLEESECQELMRDNQMCLLDLDLKQLARHLCNEMHQLYCSLEPRDLLSSVCSIERDDDDENDNIKMTKNGTTTNDTIIIDYQHDCNNPSTTTVSSSTTSTSSTTTDPLQSLVDFSEIMIHWVANEVTRPAWMRTGQTRPLTSSAVHRAKFLKRFIRLAKIFHDWKNLQLFFDIMSGLDSGPVVRLKQTWDRVPNKELKLYERMRQFMNVSGNMRALRSLHQIQTISLNYDYHQIKLSSTVASTITTSSTSLQTQPTHCFLGGIPVLALATKDLTVVHQIQQTWINDEDVEKLQRNKKKLLTQNSTPTKTNKTLVNFDKMRQMSQRIRTFYEFLRGNEQLFCVLSWRYDEDLINKLTTLIQQGGVGVGNEQQQQQQNETKGKISRRRSVSSIMGALLNASTGGGGGGGTASLSGSGTVQSSAKRLYEQQALAQRVEQYVSMLPHQVEKDHNRLREMSNYCEGGNTHHNALMTSSTGQLIMTPPTLLIRSNSRDSHSQMNAPMQMGVNRLHSSMTTTSLGGNDSSSGGQSGIIYIPHGSRNGVSGGGGSVGVGGGVDQQNLFAIDRATKAGSISSNDSGMASSHVTDSPTSSIRCEYGPSGIRRSSTGSQRSSFRQSDNTSSSGGLIVNQGNNQPIDTNKPGAICNDDE